MNANSVTGGAVERRTMDYFDRLPPSARAAVANARFDWVLMPWLRPWEAGEIGPIGLTAQIEHVDRERAAKERLRIWGPDYPVLCGELQTIQPRTKKRKNRR
ncbi:hypothetical protein [Bradyrhizobium retamae]|uniref:Uncharacterized protein n=1 Tax=Bradyrhizobium retamae TaxID=1300035 RepID=A0A0R3MP06_9BRAD|nr:hypothetical protein [Bradyrhizobium retamae]KRR21879.1 hypothetical protein CQ13_07540 [Bradyrhizobium retamae]